MNFSSWGNPSPQEFNKRHRKLKRIENFPGGCVVQSGPIRFAEFSLSQQKRRSLSRPALLSANAGLEVELAVSWINRGSALAPRNDPRMLVGVLRSWVI